MTRLIQLASAVLLSLAPVAAGATDAADGALPAPAQDAAVVPAAAGAVVASRAHRGTKEGSLAGAIFVPNSSAADTLGVVTGRLGTYLSPRDVVGVSVTFFSYSRVTDLYAAAEYRHLLGGAAARFRPFVGAAAGVNVLSYFNWGGTHNRLLLRGELGGRFVLSPRVSFDLALALNYKRGAGEDFAHSSSTATTFGVAYLF